MFVKITNGDGWYRELEGEVFEIAGETWESEDCYYAEPDEAHRLKGCRRLIDVDHCEVVSGPATKYITPFSDEVHDIDPPTWHVRGVNPGESLHIVGDTGLVRETKSSDAPDFVNHPSHYTTGKFEVIEIIEEITKGYEDPFVAYCVGSSQKYIARAPHKGKLTEDLEKAAKYIEFALDHIRGDAE